MFYDWFLEIKLLVKWRVITLVRAQPVSGSGPTDGGTVTQSELDQRRERTVEIELEIESPTANTSPPRNI